MQVGRLILIVISYPQSEIVAFLSTHMQRSTAPAVSRVDLSSMSHEVLEN